MHSWRVLLLPYMDHSDLYDQYDFAQPWDSAANRKLADQMPNIYSFSGYENPSPFMTNYVAIVGDDSAWSAPGRSDEQIQDIESSTILIVENLGQEIHWMEPKDLRLETMDMQIDSRRGISSPHVAPAVAMLDGSVRTLSLDLPADVLRAMITIDGGEQLQDEGEYWTLIPDGRLRPFKNAEPK